MLGEQTAAGRECCPATLLPSARSRRAAPHPATAKPPPATKPQVSQLPPPPLPPASQNYSPLPSATFPRQEERPESACTQLQSPQTSAPEPKEGSRYTRVWQPRGRASRCRHANCLPGPKSAPWGFSVLALLPGRARPPAPVLPFLLPLALCSGFSTHVEAVWLL